MPQRDLNAPCLQQLEETVEAVGLGLGPGQIGTIRGGKVAEKSLREDTGQPGDHLAGVGGFLCGLEAEAAHTRIHSKVESCGLALAASLLRQCLGIVQGGNGGTETVFHSHGKGLHRGVTQDQNGGGKARFLQLQSLGNRGHTEEISVFFQQTGDFNGAVAVAIGFEYHHHRHIDFIANGFKIFGNGIQIHSHIGVVVKQRDQLRSFFGYFIISWGKWQVICQAAVFPDPGR